MRINNTISLKATIITHIWLTDFAEGTLRLLLLSALSVPLVKCITTYKIRRDILGICTCVKKSISSPVLVAQIRTLSSIPPVTSQSPPTENFTVHT